MVYVVSAMLVVMVFETWCLWRVLDRLGVLARFEDRLSTVAHSVALLNETTETCFQVVASQIESGNASRAAAPTGRAARQRRVVGAVRQGKTVTETAATEEVAESEVRLRLYLAERDAEKGRESHGSMLTQ
jgi:hypothetical protein